MESGYLNDVHGKELKEQLSIIPDPESGYTYHSGVLRYKGRIYVGNDSELRQNIIRSLHTSVVGGNSGRVATYHRNKSLLLARDEEGNSHLCPRLCSMSAL